MPSRHRDRGARGKREIVDRRTAPQPNQASLAADPATTRFSRNEAINLLYQAFQGCFSRELVSDVLANNHDSVADALDSLKSLCQDTIPSTSSSQAARQGQSAEGEGECLWEKLPEQCKEIILGHLSLEHLARIARTCRDFAQHIRTIRSSKRHLVVPTSMDRPSAVAGFIAAHPAADHLSLRHVARLFCQEPEEARGTPRYRVHHGGGCVMDMRDVARGVAARQGGLPVRDLDLTHFSSLGLRDIRDICDGFAHLQKLRLGHCEKLDDAALRLLAAYRRAPPRASEANCNTSCTAAPGPFSPCLVPSASIPADDIGSTPCNPRNPVEQARLLGIKNGGHGMKGAEGGDSSASQLSSAEALLQQHGAEDEDPDDDGDMASLPGLESDSDLDMDETAFPSLAPEPQADEAGAAPSAPESGELHPQREAAGATSSVSHTALPCAEDVRTSTYRVCRHQSPSDSQHLANPFTAVPTGSPTATTANPSAANPFTAVPTDSPTATKATPSAASQVTAAPTDSLTGTTATPSSASQLTAAPTDSPTATIATPSGSRRLAVKKGAKKGPKVRLEDFLADTCLDRGSPQAHSSPPLAALSPAAGRPAGLLGNNSNHGPHINEKLHRDDQTLPQKDAQQGGDGLTLQSSEQRQHLQYLQHEQANLQSAAQPPISRSGWAQQALTGVGPGGNGSFLAGPASGVQGIMMGSRESGLTATEPAVGGLRSTKLGLEDLYISHCPQVTAVGVRSLVMGSGSASTGGWDVQEAGPAGSLVPGAQGLLRRLTCNNCSCLRDLTLQLPHAATLQHLTLAACPCLHRLHVSARHLETLSVAQCKALRQVKIQAGELTRFVAAGCGRLESLEDVGSLPCLTHLSLTGCLQLSSAGLEEVLAGMPSLAEVDANGCTAITAFPAVTNFQLARLNLTGCAVLRRIVVGSPIIQRLFASSCPRLLELRCLRQRPDELQLKRCDELSIIQLGSSTAT
ncbi:hypothetical protein WJX74_003770 [Apatococcus lobatus]|uniref:F-box domain-containing protein n=1 Tax=Apatococcus lobatus TaxID=904363 RepID=A0AAW1QU29_9CHLO